MAKVILFVLMCAALIGLGNCAAIFWNGTVTSGSWGASSSWQNGTVPGNNDCVYITATSALTITIPSGTSVGNVTLFSPANVNLVVFGGQFTVTGALAIRGSGTVSLRVDAGASVQINAHLEIANSNTNFALYGTVTAGALKAAASSGTDGLTNTGPSSVLLTGSLPHVIDSSFVVSASTFTFSQSATHSFYQTAATGGSNTLKFIYTPTLSTLSVINNYFNPIPVSFFFAQGANFLTATPIATTNSSGTKGTVTFQGSYSVSVAATIDATPTFSGPTLVFNGGSLTFTNYNPTFSGGAQTLLGTGGLIFQSTDNNIPNSATFNTQVDVYISPFSFTRTGTTPPNWSWTGSGSLNFYTPYSINTIITTGVQTTFFFPFTFASGTTHLRGGPYIFWDSLINNAGTLVLQTAPTFKCNNGIFNFSGNAIAFNNGITIAGCAINTQQSPQVTVSTSITVSGNSTIDTAQVTLNFTDNAGQNTFTFTGNNNPANSLNSLTIRGAFPSIPVNMTYTANTIDLVLNNSLGMVSGVRLAGTGQITFNAGFSVADNNVFTVATIALPSGSVVLGQTSAQGIPVTFGSNLLLRNTVLTGAALINFSGTITVLNGFSYINTNNFVINGATTVNYLANGSAVINFPEVPALVFSAGSQRNLANGITAGQKVNVIFNDAIAFTGAITLTSTNAGSAITFNQSTTQTILLNALPSDSFTVTGNTFFNASTTRVSGPGTFNVVGNLTTQGAVNNPGAANDAIIILSPTFLFATANTIFGPTVQLGTGSITTDDYDRNTSTSLTSITFNYTQTPFPLPNAAYTFNNNVTFLGSVFLKSTSAVTFSGPASFVTFNGNCLLLQSSVTFNIRTIFNNAVNISDNSNNNAFTVLFNAPTFPTQNRDGLWLGGNVFVNLGITLTFQSQLNVYFLNTLSIFGTGTVTTNSQNFFGTNAVVTISPLFLNMNGGTTNPTTFFGSGSTSYVLNPFNSQANFNTIFVANVPVNFIGAAITLTGSTTIPSAFTFTNSTVTFTGPGPLIFAGARTLAATNAFVFKDLSSVTFRDTVTINNGLPFSSIGATTTLTFLYDIILGNGPVTITLPVTFGQNSFSSETVSGNTLTLTGDTITVNGNINILSGIVSNRQGSIQTINGAVASYNNLWTYSVGVCFSGTFNFTAPITVDRAHTLKAAGTNSLTYTQGLSFSGAGAFAGTGSLCVFNYLNNTGSTTLNLPTGVSITTANSPFLVTGLFLINGTYTCRAATTFANNIIFGNTALGTANPININDNCQWLGTSTVTLYRTSIVTTFNGANIFTPLIYACTNNSLAFSGAQVTNLNIFGDVTVSGPGINFAGANLGAITITTTFNLATVSNVKPTTLLTFNSNPTASEPIVSFFTTVTQPLNLLAPIRVDGLNLGNNAAIYTTNGQGRIDIGNSVTVSSTVQISAPANLFVTSNATGTNFVVTLSSARSTFSLTPTLNSPFGFPAPNFVFSTAANSVIRFTANPTLTFNSVTVSGTGATRFSSGTVNIIGTLLVNPGATFWQDLSSITAFNATFVPPPSTTADPSYYQVTVSSASPPTISTQYVVYGGGAIVFLSNFAPTQTTNVNVINAALAAFGNVLSPITGTPGYTYSASRNGNGLTLTITPNSGPAPIPTQSNGPAPPVSAAPSQFFSFVVLFVSFALVFISLC